MARSWTRLHEHLGTPPGPLSFDMVQRATAERLQESDDLDWKEQLPQRPQDGRWNEFAKDVAAMANTRGGLLVFGVRDQTIELVGIDLEQVNTQQYAQWVRNHVQPYLPDLDFIPLTSPEGISVLVVDVPASTMAPHHVYGTAAKDKDQQAAVVPYRDKDHTAWMAEHQIERAYRDRFTRAQRTEEEVQRLLDYAQDTVSARQNDPSAWFLAVARPERPLPRTAPRPAREDATTVINSARARSRTLTTNDLTPGPLAGLQIVTSNPRPGLRRWVLNTLTLGGGREIYAELHHDGSVVLAANLSWKAIREDFLGEAAPEWEALVHQAFLGACCRDLAATAQELGRRLRVDGVLHLTATIARSGPGSGLAPVVIEYGGFTDIPAYARRPHLIQPVVGTLIPTGGDDALRETAQDLFTDLMTQFGLDPQM
ncbi:helix-turn-helix domain-containing protein [Streptomyces sp. NPDC086835]|uniref:AlbA family DNA-binding domain-containing protein n=1 Tax=Streptomyces sp. NPDC086835 TaxID=3365761 RepID=UPI0037F3E5F7